MWLGGRGLSLTPGFSPSVCEDSNKCLREFSQMLREFDQMFWGESDHLFGRGGGNTLTKKSIFQGLFYCPPPPHQQTLVRPFIAIISIHNNRCTLVLLEAHYTASFQLFYSSVDTLLVPLIHSCTAKIIAFLDKKI